MLENKKTQWTKLAFRNIFTVFFTVQRFLIHFEISEKMYSRDILIFTIRTLNMLHIYTSFFRVKLDFLIHWDSEGDQPWDFFGRNDAKAETPVLWPPHAPAQEGEANTYRGMWRSHQEGAAIATGHKAGRTHRSSLSHSGHHSALREFPLLYSMFSLVIDFIHIVNSTIG